MRALLRAVVGEMDSSKEAIWRTFLGGGNDAPQSPLEALREAGSLRAEIIVI